MRTHKDLDAWKLSVEFVTEVYKITRNFPKEELFGLSSQLRRAAVSIPSNIAEGAARQTTKEFVQFLHIALGSQQEVDTQLLVAKNLGFIGMKEYEELIVRIDKIGKMLNGLIKYFRKKN
jgi:four helix bundle protein